MQGQTALMHPYKGGPVQMWTGLQSPKAEITDVEMLAIIYVYASS